MTITSTVPAPGSRLRIVADTVGHGFPIGSLVTATPTNDGTDNDPRPACGIRSCVRCKPAPDSPPLYFLATNRHADALAIMDDTEHTIGETAWVRADQFETDPTAFVEGDHVQIIDAAGDPFNAITNAYGTVTRAAGSGRGTIAVLQENGAQVDMLPFRFRLALGEEPAVKIGDKVKIDSDFLRRHGQTGTLTKRYGRGYVFAYEVEFENGETQGFHAHEPEPEPLKIGDRVKRVGPHLANHGRNYYDRESTLGDEGTVVRVWPGDPQEVSVTWDRRGNRSRIVASSLEKIDATPEPTPDPTPLFARGTLVTVSDGGKYDGVILNGVPDEDGDVLVAVLNDPTEPGVEGSWYVDYFDTASVKALDVAPLADLPEPVTAAEEAITIGSTVRSKPGATSFYGADASGRIGTVKKRTTAYDDGRTTRDEWLVDFQGDSVRGRIFVADDLVIADPDEFLPGDKVVIAYPYDRLNAPTWSGPGVVEKVFPGGSVSVLPTGTQRAATGNFGPGAFKPAQIKRAA